jgi:hypothetical protein
MASTKPARTQIVGTTALPIVMSATGGAADVATWTHNRAQFATKITPLVAVGRGAVQFPAGAAAGLGLVVTQSTNLVIVVTNTSAVAIDIVLEVVWGEPSNDLGAPVAASAVVLS